MVQNNHVTRAEQAKGIVSTDGKIISSYLSHLATLTDTEEMKAIVELFPVRTFKKGTILLRAGEVATETYYVLKGLVRQYYLTSGQPAKHFLSCLEESTLSIVARDKEVEFYQRFPRFEKMCRVSTEEELGNYQDMLATYITSSPEERYFNLTESRPELLDRVPQYQLASFLGVKPESLSRIRKRIAKGI